jgi:ribonuclease-3
MAIRSFLQGNRLKLTPEAKAFCARLGHEFSNPDLVLQALTHSSLSSGARQDYQRLEFLGDRVLGLVIAEALLADDTQAAEGDLAPRLNALVRKETCADVATSIDLGSALMMGRSESQSGGRRKVALLGDAMEAVIAAIYLDAGFERAREMILRLWGGRIASAHEIAADPKSELQEWAQARKMPPPTYTVIERSGPDHAPEFVIEVQVKSGQSASAKAQSKRAAQQAAAEALLTQLGVTDD